MSQNHVFAQTANLDDLSIDAILGSSLISQHVIDQSSTFSGIRRKQFIACRYLLAELLNQYFDVATLPNIIIGKNSRPHFAKMNLPDFNISHSGDFVAVAISTQGRVGLDIELNLPRKNHLIIAKQCFSTAENNWLNQQTDSLAAFWRIWTLREAALKLYAKGVWQMKEMRINMPQQQIIAQFATNFFPSHQQIGPLYLSICCDNSIDSISINQ